MNKVHTEKLRHIGQEEVSQGRRSNDSQLHRNQAGRETEKLH